MSTKELSFFVVAADRPELENIQKIINFDVPSLGSHNLVSKGAKFITNAFENDLN